MGQYPDLGVQRRRRQRELLRERPSRFQLFGALLAFAGNGIVAVNMGGDISAGGLLALALVLAALPWAVANMLSKRMGKVSMFALVVWGRLVVPLPILALSFLVEGSDRIAESLGLIRGSTLGPSPTWSIRRPCWASRYGTGCWVAIPRPAWPRSPCWCRCLGWRPRWRCCMRRCRPRRSLRSRSSSCACA